MDQATLQFLYLMGGLLINLAVIVGLFTKQEKRMTKIETLLSQCCNNLDIHTGGL